MSSRPYPSTISFRFLLGFPVEAFGLGFAVPLLGADFLLSSFDPDFVKAASGWALVPGARLKLGRVRIEHGQDVCKKDLLVGILPVSGVLVRHFPVGCGL